MPCSVMSCSVQFCLVLSSHVPVLSDHVLSWPVRHVQSSSVLSSLVLYYLLIQMICDAMFPFSCGPFPVHREAGPVPDIHSSGKCSVPDVHSSGNCSVPDIYSSVPQVTVQFQISQIQVRQTSNNFTLQNNCLNDDALRVSFLNKCGGLFFIQISHL